MSGHFRNRSRRDAIAAVWTEQDARFGDFGPSCQRTVNVPHLAGHIPGQAQIASGCQWRFTASLRTTAWHAYEGIQQDIFDHLLAILQEFDLHVFQNPNGRDFQAYGPLNECASPRHLDSLSAILVK